MRVLIIAAVELVAAAAIFAQDSGESNRLQFHGFATQAFVVSSHNNYLGMDTCNGSAGWTEAALNVNDQVTEKLRVGIQLHYTRLGAFGGDAPTVDWAAGDYAFNENLGLRAGKVKIRWGLYNDTQDYDPGYLWSLLPEPVYAVDWRATDLAQNGVEIYGKVPLGEGSRLQFSAYYGDYTDASNDGYAENYIEEGVNFVTNPGGRTPGADLRWVTPLQGLTIGASLMTYNANGTLLNGTYREPMTFWPAYYAKYDYKNLFLSGQYTKLVEYDITTVTGGAPSIDGTDTRAWFAMEGYHLTSKLQAGAYYTHYLDASGGDSSDPGNFYGDWVVSTRYDINAGFYAKLEAHFIDGNGVGFYGFDNLDGLARRTNVVVGKLGFTF